MIRVRLSLLAGWLIASLGAAEAAPAASVGCGAWLSGTVFVLHQDLTCAPDNEDAALSVVDGATLDMNGHTLTCSPDAKTIGVAVGRGTVQNGTVKGCWFGITTYEGVVKHMRLTGNVNPIVIGNHNMIVGNVADHNLNGFAFYEDAPVRGNTLLHNTASHNYWGFDLTSDFWVGDTTIVGNVADHNVRAGFLVAGDVGTTLMMGNRAEANGEDGFALGGTRFTVVGNTAKDNGASGFFLNDPRGFTLTQNRAEGNGGTGFDMFFSLESTERDGPLPHERLTLTGNTALHNKGHGIHLPERRPENETKASITLNAAHGHAVDLADDDARCAGATWRFNSFGTASRACIR